MAHDVRLLARHPDLLAERHNYTATADPTVNDDENDYYGVGSVWVNRLTNTVFICCDPTNGAAVWSVVGATEAVESVIDPTANDDINDGFVRGSTWINTTNSTIWHCIDNSAGAAVWQISVKVHSTNADPTVNDDVNLGYIAGSTWINTTNDTIWICVDNTDGAAVWAEQAATTSTIQKATATIPYNDADGKVTLLTMPANGFIRFVGKVVTTAYDAGTVTVGEEGDEANLMTAELVDAQGATPDTYTPNKYYASGSVIKAFITPGAATEGTFTLILEYVTV